MRHIWRRQEECRPGAPVLELVSVADRDELVKLAMYDESRAGYTVHTTQIIELLGEEEAQEADLVRRHTFN